LISGQAFAGVERGTKRNRKLGSDAVAAGELAAHPPVYQTVVVFAINEINALCRPIVKDGTVLLVDKNTGSPIDRVRFGRKLKPGEDAKAVACVPTRQQLSKIEGFQSSAILSEDGLLAGRENKYAFRL
jgi:hypothetical protein